MPPAKKVIYAGTKGKTHGDKKESIPAVIAVNIPTSYPLI